MPDIVPQAYLHADELDLLKAAIDNTAVEELLQEIRKEAKRHRDHIAQAVSAGTFTANQIDGIRSDLAARLQLIDPIPLDLARQFSEHLRSALQLLDDIHAKLRP
jgi:hypothetical protein